MKRKQLNYRETVAVVTGNGGTAKEWDRIMKELDPRDWDGPIDVWRYEIASPAFRGTTMAVSRLEQAIRDAASLDTLTGHR